MRPQKTRTSFSCLGASLLAVLFAGGTWRAEPLGAQDRYPGRIVGRVVDQGEGTPISGAELRIRGLPLQSVSDDVGRFVFRSVPPGPRVLEVSHISYRIRTDSIFVPPEETLEIQVSLVVEPVPMEPLVVSLRSRVLEVGGFYRRRDQGLSGLFLTREQIAERRPIRLTDLFVSVPGVRLAQQDGVGPPVVVFPRGSLLDGGSETCHPDVWLDGIVSDALDLDRINPDQVEGLEVYRGAGSPLRFSTTCGAILIWTHVPEKRGG